MADLAMPWLVHSLPPVRDLTTSRLTLFIDIGVDTRVLLFSLALSTLTAILFSLAPSITFSRMKLDNVLRGAKSSHMWRGQRSILTIQIALCTLLLVEAGLLVRTLKNLHEIDPGFDRDHVVSFTLDPLRSGYTKVQAVALRVQCPLRVNNLPGVVSAATARFPVMRGSGMKMTVAPMGQSISPAAPPNASLNEVSAAYFGALGLRILAGHGLIDSADPPPKLVPVVVNAAFVREFFPEVSPVGRRFGTRYKPDAFEIVGVVSDAKYRSLRESTPATFYEVFYGGADRFVLYVRTGVRPEYLIPLVRRELSALDSALPIEEIHTLAEEVDASTSADRLVAMLASIFGMFAALLAAIGIYGFLAFIVAGRQRQIAIHLAVGANRLDIGRMIAPTILTDVLIGVLIGLGAALLLGPSIRSLLYGIAPDNPVALFSAAAAVIVIAVLGAAVPTLRATQVEPATHLHCDN